MKGLALSKYYYETIGHPALEKNIPALLPRMAIGLAGEGSECFGFDDKLSHDHDWGPSFCIWLEEEDYRRFGAQVQKIYDSLPGEAAGFPSRQKNSNIGRRVGCLCTQMWYTYYTGAPQGPKTMGQWRHVPEAFLATAINGEIFYDPSDCFSAIRRRLQGFYPEDVRMKKIVARAAVMAQAGQYNHSRCLKRDEPVGAQLALAEFTKAALSMVYLLNRRYAPFYKWMHRGVAGLEKLPCSYVQLARLSKAEHGAEKLIEGICLNTIGELRRQGLTDRTDTFLLDHCEEMMKRIQDPHIRQMHIMEE